MKVYYTTTDGGDGSKSVAFFKNEPDLEALEEADPDTYMACELGEFEIPDGPNTIRFQD